MFSNRPRIKIPLTLTDKIVEVLGALFVWASWSIVNANYSSLPDVIPIHFDASGTADGFGDKSNIFALPVVSTVVFIALTILNRFPHLFNYPAGLTLENARTQYSIATSMIRFLKLSVAIVFAMIVYFAVQNAKGETDGLGSWFLPTVLALIFLPIVYFFYKSAKNS